MARTKATPAAEQFAALGFADPLDWTPAMALAVKQKWTNLPVDRKVDVLRADLAAVMVSVTATAHDLVVAGFSTDADACATEASRLVRNAKVNAWRVRNQIQAALDARALKFAILRQSKAVKAAVVVA